MRASVATFATSAAISRRPRCLGAPFVMSESIVSHVRGPRSVFDRRGGSCSPAEVSVAQTSFTSFGNWSRFCHARNLSWQCCEISAVGSTDRGSHERHWGAKAMDSCRRSIRGIGIDRRMDAGRDVRAEEPGRQSCARAIERRPAHGCGRQRISSCAHRTSRVGRHRARCGNRGGAGCDCVARSRGEVQGSRGEVQGSRGEVQGSRGSQARACGDQAGKDEERNTISGGTWAVGSDVRPGTYRAKKPVAASCYWEITSDANGNDIVANDIPGGGRPTVTLSEGQYFSTNGCGEWGRQ